MTGTEAKEIEITVVHCRIGSRDQHVCIFLDVATLLYPDHDPINFSVKKKKIINLHLLQAPQLVIWILGITCVSVFNFFWTEKAVSTIFS